MYRATWQDATSREETNTFDTKNAAAKEVARHAAGGLRFHDLRHSYATWLISDGVPVNDVQRVMGHERPSTTLDLYTHAQKQLDNRVRNTFADDPLTHTADEAHEQGI